VFGVPTESDKPVCSTPSRYDLNRQFILFCGSQIPHSPSQHYSRRQNTTLTFTIPLSPSQYHSHS